MKFVDLIREDIARSSGILLYSGLEEDIKVFLIHPGGPYFVNKDAGAWGIPKGHVEAGESIKTTAIREFSEETGISVNANTDAEYIGTIKTGGNKIVYAFAVKGSGQEQFKGSNTMTMEWPPKSGKQISFPEVDKGEWFSISEAKKKMNTKQIPFIDTLLKYLKKTKV